MAHKQRQAARGSRGRRLKQRQQHDDHDQAVSQFVSPRALKKKGRYSNMPLLGLQFLSAPDRGTRPKLMLIMVSHTGNHITQIYDMPQQA
eukprot:111919-Pelagomonas_calceolata.AAC.4